MALVMPVTGCLVPAVVWGLRLLVARGDRWALVVPKVCVEFGLFRLLAVRFPNKVVPNRDTSHPRPIKIRTPPATLPVIFIAHHFTQLKGSLVLVFEHYCIRHEANKSASFEENGFVEDILAGSSYIGSKTRIIAVGVEHSLTVAVIFK